MDWQLQVLSPCVRSGILVSVIAWVKNVDSVAGSIDGPCKCSASVTASSFSFLAMLGFPCSFGNHQDPYELENWAMYHIPLYNLNMAYGP